MITIRSPKSGSLHPAAMFTASSSSGRANKSWSLGRGRSFTHRLRNPAVGSSSIGAGQGGDLGGGPNLEENQFVALDPGFSEDGGEPGGKVEG